MRNRPLILIVDDEPIMRESLEALLGGRDYDVALAVDATDALQQIQRTVPDVMLVDLMMPGMNGLELCRTLRANPRVDHTPIILLTAHSEKENLIAALEAGADEFVAKPASGVELRARVRSLLRLKVLSDRQRVLLKQREELVHMIVHDMRQPITIIGAFASLVRGDLEDDGGNLERIRKIETQAVRLNKFANELLLVAKSEEGCLTPAWQPVDIGQLVQAIAADYAVVAQSKEITLKPMLPAGAFAVEADPSLVSRAVENLLSNAFKFSSAKTTVEIRLTTAANDFWALEVADQGPGIAEEHREKIFDKYSAPDLRKQGVLQVGLGLAFCRLVAQTHDGSITVRPNQPKGSVFRLELPRTRANAKLPPAAVPA